MAWKKGATSNWSRIRSKARSGPRPLVEGKYDATFIRAVDRLRALKFGAKIVEVPPMAMIEGVTLTTTTTYVKNHEDECRSLIMALIDGTHFFKTKKADTLAIIQKHCSELLKMRDDEEWDCFYENQADSLENAPYPSIEAIQNVFALGGEARSGDQRIQSAGAVGFALRQGDRRQRLYPKVYA